MGGSPKGTKTFGKHNELSDADFMLLFDKHGAQGLADRQGLNVRSVYRRRENLEMVYQRQLKAPTRNTRVAQEHPARFEIEVRNGVVLVGSDAHIRPGSVSTAMRAFTHFCREMKPKAAIMNGDVMDFPQISRHPRIGWDSHPTVQEEIEAAQDQLHEIERAVPRGCHRIWTLGNHDARYEVRLATVAPEYAKIHGVHLKDFFPLWQPCWSVFVNKKVAIKHRWKSGINAPRANALNAGLSMVTGHLHRLNVTGLTDYQGTRYGVDSGCLANPSGKQFVDYTEDAPLDWASGFVVLTFKDGELLRPEIAQVFGDSSIQFRGDVIKV